MVVLHILFKGAKYTVTDAKGRTIYNIKKSSFGGKIHLNDASGYKLYSMTSSTKQKKPLFNVLFNDKAFFEVQCMSMFLDPSFKVAGGNINLDIISSDRRVFSIKKDGEEIGRIMSPEAAAEAAEEAASNDGEKPAEDTKKREKTVFPYVMEISPDYFDDYVPLFAVCIEETFGKLNKEL